MDTRAPSANPKMRTKELKAGDRVGAFIVKAVAEGRLTLRGSRAFAAKAIAFGGVATILGLCAWASVLRGDAAQTGAHGKVLMLPIVGIGCIIFGMLGLAEVWEFDRASRTLVCLGFFGHKILPPGMIRRVQISVLPTNLNQRETVVLKLIAESRRFLVGSHRSKNPNAGNLIAAAEHVATFLGVPIEIVGELLEAPAPLLESFSALAESDRPFDLAA